MGTRRRKVGEIFVEEKKGSGCGGIIVAIIVILIIVSQCSS